MVYYINFRQLPAISNPDSKHSAQDHNKAKEPMFNFNLYSFCFQVVPRIMNCQDQRVVSYVKIIFINNQGTIISKQNSYSTKDSGNTNSFIAKYNKTGNGEMRENYIKPRRRNPIIRLVLKNGLSNVRFNVALTVSNSCPID